MRTADVDEESSHRDRQYCIAKIRYQWIKPLGEKLTSWNHYFITTIIRILRMIQSKLIPGIYRESNST